MTDCRPPTPPAKNAKRPSDRRRTKGTNMTDVGYRMHAAHVAPPRATDEAREILASLMEPQFPVEAERVRKGQHFMLPASWAVEAIQAALDGATG